MRQFGVIRPADDELERLVAPPLRTSPGAFARAHARRASRPSARICRPPRWSRLFALAPGLQEHDRPAPYAFPRWRRNRRARAPCSRAIGWPSPITCSSGASTFSICVGGVVEARAFGTVDLMKNEPRSSGGASSLRHAVTGVTRRHRASTITRPSKQRATDAADEQPPISGRRCAFKRLSTHVRRPLVAVRAHQQLAAHHRGQGQRDEGRDRDRGGQRHRQFAEQAPGLPFEEGTGRNTATSTAVVAITANATWRVPRCAATSGGSPRSTRRWRSPAPRWHRRPPGRCTAPAPAA
jgi:hypothetical protein